MRGSPRHPGSHQPVDGIIPAHAGLTLCLGGNLYLSGDHPRACGAHRCLNRSPSPLAGSSPRMRGSLQSDKGVVQNSGIIPAHAGLTSPMRILVIAGGDHPRACGAHGCASKISMRPAGSSPRMRGSHIVEDLVVPRVGIIPAHAGLTNALATVAGPLGDHPRACGAHFIYGYLRPASSGSSPRMRGSLLQQVIRWQVFGIIPAHAGLTAASVSTKCARWDHPRACGAHRATQTAGALERGSSPRMRGSPFRHRSTLRIFGIIPAHAGLTDLIDSGIYLEWDHPRACGAH